MRRQNDKVLPGQVEVHDVAIVLGPVVELEPPRLLGQLVQVANDGQRLGAGGQAGTASGAAQEEDEGRRGYGRQGKIQEKHGSEETFRGERERNGRVQKQTVCYLAGPAQDDFNTEPAVETAMWHC